MVDIIDFITKGTQGGNKPLVEEFVTLLKKSSAAELEAWFQKKGYAGISLQECERMVSNKDSIISVSDKALMSTY